MLETAHINPPPRDELHRLSRQIGDLIGTLQAQHGILGQRGIHMPSGALEKLIDLQADLDQLVDRLADESTELDQLRALAKTTRLITSSLEPDEVLNGVLDMAIALTGAERGYIVLRSPHTGDLQFRAARDLNRQTIDENRFAVSQTIIAEAAETGQPVIAFDALADPKYDMQKSIVAHLPRSIICVPLIFKNQINGVLYADNRHIPNLFSEREASLLVAFANQAAIAIENARLFDHVRRTLIESTEIKELMDNVLASIASGVITTNNDGIIITYNQAAEYILGIHSGAALHQPLHTVLPSVFEGFDLLVQTVLQEDRQQVVEIEPVLSRRGPVNLSLRFTPLKDAQGMTYGMALVVDDLTEIKKRDATLNVVRTYLPPSLVRNIQSIDNLGLGGDEREISVIFADVRGFVTFCEHLDPEQLMTTISQYLTVSSDAIELYDGIIDKYMGDAVVGLFNTQLNPQEDHAVRAVRAALSMAYDVRALHEVLPLEQRLFYGIGVDTGMAMLGNVGSPSRKEFTAIGPPFNFAKLLQENALAGEIIISQHTYERVKDIFVTEPLTPRKIKDYGDFHVMYRVTGVKKHDE